MAYSVKCSYPVCEGGILVLWSMQQLQVHLQLLVEEQHLLNALCWALLPVAKHGLTPSFLRLHTLAPGEGTFQLAFTDIYCNSPFSLSPFCVIWVLRHITFIYITPITRHCHANTLPSSGRIWKWHSSTKNKISVLLLALHFILHCFSLFKL